MRITAIAALAVSSFSCALLGVACVQSSEPTSQTDGWLDLDPALEPSATAMLSDAAEDPQLLALCLALAPASVPTKEAFCRSLPDVGSRGRCWKYRWNRAEWIGWCYAEFG